MAWIVYYTSRYYYRTFYIFISTYHVYPHIFALLDKCIALHHYLDISSIEWVCQLECYFRGEKWIIIATSTQRARGSTLHSWFIFTSNIGVYAIRLFIESRALEKIITRVGRKNIKTEYFINRRINMFMYSFLARFVQCRVSTALLIAVQYLRPHCGSLLHVTSYTPPCKQSKRDKFPRNQRLYHSLSCLLNKVHATSYICVHFSPYKEPPIKSLVSAFNVDSYF